MEAIKPGRNKERFMLHAVHIAVKHHPLDVRIFHKEVRSLVDAGYRVTMIVAGDAMPIGQGAELVDWVLLPRSRRRVDNMTRLLWRVYQAAQALEADLYHIHELNLLIPALALKRAGKRVIYDIHEDYPTQLANNTWDPAWLVPWQIRATVALEAQAMNKLDGFVAATPVIAARFPATRTVTVQNFPKLEEFPAPGPVPHELRPQRFVYIGRVGRIRGIVEMQRAMHLLANTHPEAELVIIGNDPDADVRAELAATPGGEHVRFLGWRDRAGVAAALAEARAGLVLLHPVRNYIDSQPVKMYEYMAAGLPVVASDFPLWRQVIAGVDCGYLVDPLDPTAIAAALRAVLDDPAAAQAQGARGRAAVEQRYNWEHEAEHLLELYQRITAQMTSA